MSDPVPRGHILVVDDTQEIIDLLRELLEEEGYRVSTSIETLDLTRIKALKPDLIVQDLLFAGMQETGWHFLTMVRLDPDLAHIPLILCTAASELINDPTTAENMDRHGVRVLLKPFNINELLTMVAEMLAAQKLLNQVRDDEPASQD